MQCINMTAQSVTVYQVLSHGLLLFLTLLHTITPSHSLTNHTLDNNITVTTKTNQRNCSNSFSVLEESLLSHEDNRFNLLKTFYPPRGAHPVFLTVTYRFSKFGKQFDEGGEQGSPENSVFGDGSGGEFGGDVFDDSEIRSGMYGNESVWYWSASEVYLVQPLDVLQFTSLFHSNLQYRTSEVELELDRECLGTKRDYLEILTQRVSELQLNYIFELCMQLYRVFW